MKKTLETIIQNKAIHPVLYAVGAIIAIFVALYISDVKTDTKLEQYVEQSTKHKKDAANALKFADSLSVIVKVTEDSNKKSTEIIDSLKMENRRIIAKTNVLVRDVASLKNVLVNSLTTTDSIQTLVGITTTQDSIIIKKDSVIGGQQDQIFEYEVMKKRADFINYTMKLQNDSLRTTIKTTPYLTKNPEKLFGIITLPSRKTTFVVGILSGAVASYYLTTKDNVKIINNR